MSEHDEAKGADGAAPRRRRRSRRRSSRPAGPTKSALTSKPASSGEQSAAPSNHTEQQNKPEGTANKPRRRRPNRRRRSRGGAGTPPGSKQQGSKQQGQKQQNQSSPRNHSDSGNQGASSSTDSAAEKKLDTASSQPRKKANRSRRRRGNGQQSQNRRQQRNRGKTQSQRQQRRMHTSDETSAGGLVVSGLAEAVSPSGEVDLNRIYVALIGRLDRRGRLLWSMPKGHVEPGEDHCETAEREVWEETGIECEVFADLGTIDYWFVSEGTRIHKTVHHHLLRFVDGDLNDEDPEVTEVSWIRVGELLEKLAYADERKLARRAHDLLPDLARAEKEAGRATPR